MGVARETVPCSIFFIRLWYVRRPLGSVFFHMCEGTARLRHAIPLDLPLSPPVCRCSPTLHAVRCSSLFLRIITCLEIGPHRRKRIDHLRCVASLGPRDSRSSRSFRAGVSRSARAASGPSHSAATVRSPNTFRLERLPDRQ